MTAFRLWSAVNQLTTKPQPSATSDWWNLCDTCNHLDGPHDTQAAAEAVTHRCGKRKPRSEPAEQAKGHVWTDAEDDLVRTLPPTQAAQAIGVSDTTITRHRAHLGVGQVRAVTFPWTPELDAILVANGIADAMRLTGASKSAVEWRRKQLADQGIWPNADGEILDMERQAISDLVPICNLDRPLSEADRGTPWETELKRRNSHATMRALRILGGA